MATLLRLAEDVLGEVGSSDSEVAKVEEYVKAFDRWLQQWGLEQDREPLADRGLLIELAEKHQQIIEFASRLKMLTSEELKNLQRKGRGLVAYTEGFSSGTKGTFSNKEG